MTEDAVATWCEGRVAASTRRPVVIGINGPQGGGKSTLAARLVDLLGQRGLRAVALSIDDFYLTHAEQRALAVRFAGVRTLEHRGYPGTHDVALGARALSALRSGQPVRIPVYDKAAHGGRGDRAPESAWRLVEPPLDCVLFEGWMLAFTPVDDATLEPELRPPNERLRAYAAWDAELDALIRIEARALEDVVHFRVDAERARRARGEVGLSDDDARDYIERFLPAYRAYLPGLRTRSFPLGTLDLLIGADRRPLAPPRGS